MMSKTIRATLIFTFSVLCFSSAHSSYTGPNREAISYFSYLSTLFVSRPLTAAEIQTLSTRGQEAFPQILRAWAQEEAFYENVRIYFDLFLRTSGQDQGINYDLPGYLAKAIAKNQRPYSEILTSSTCYNSELDPIPCDTGAPFTAGVLTTRAFLASNKGVYNIARAGKIVSKFLCTDYPLPQAEEPPLRPDELISEFATTNGAITFGNGNNCYSCHSQFGLHAQFFVKFDLNGNYFAEATGLQDPSTGDGISFNQTSTSHYRAPSSARLENSRMLGRPASNLVGAAQAIVQSRRWLPCGVENLMKHFLKLSDTQLRAVPHDLFVQISRDARGLRPDPGFAELLEAIVTNPFVFQSYRRAGAEL